MKRAEAEERERLRWEAEREAWEKQRIRRLIRVIVFGVGVFVVMVVGARVWTIFTGGF
ncbi:hypothetical protein [Microbacterium sp. TPU 3598]|uniref:hypothetical protein n=1 Tax=Microbacterium sp. TPU 3598 TaxID=1938334 RepID=UPI0012FD2448|nr:hypothetical protein [Microbacterium sp. TPU 3598]